jgi:formate dehydrogenase subunit gamma
MSRTVVRQGELLRHPIRTRILHWSVAVCFLAALLTGFGIYSPWLFHWIAPLFGGGAMTRFLHPWFSLAFVIVFTFQLFNWIRPMTWTREDTRWIREIRSYVSNAHDVEPPTVGFFNGGQKAYFWAIVLSALLFLISGLPMWLPELFGRGLVWIGYMLHDLAALVMLGGFLIHLYETTFGQPGTFHSMTRGVVSRRWAWTHHPAWYHEVTGHSARDDYERAKQGSTQMHPESPPAP